ncbi:MAG TPA: metal ABC transporter permease [Acidimicrobiales bacterium]|nr:metal ABC transporter permease [Acidimicrobiales bacterium]
MHVLFEPGFFSSAPVHTALEIGTITAVVSAVVGIFTVVRSQSFAGHALTDVATTGGSGSFYLGLSPLLGFIGGGVIGAGAMDLIGVQRVRSRDLATGIVLGAATGLAALFLYLDTTTSATTGATQQILFGSIFTVDPSTMPAVIGLSVLTILVLGAIHRPLLLTSVSPELAAARGISLRLVGLLFMLTMAIAVGLSSIAIGSILSTALLIGPAATALRVTRRLRQATLLACALGVATTWLGILFAYDSDYWDPGSQGLPVSFFIVALVFLLYLGSGLPLLRRRAGRAIGAGGALGPEFEVMA